MIRKSTSSLLFLVFGLFLVIYSNYSLGDFDQFGAAFMPTISGLGTILFSILDLMFNLKQKNSFTEKVDFKYILLICAAIIFYVSLSNTLGFVITGVIITYSLMALFSKKSKIKLLIISISVVIFVYFLFAKILLVPLPQLLS